MSQSVAPMEAGPERTPVADRVLEVVRRRGYVGITRDELLRKVGVSYDDLVAALKELRAAALVRVHWPTPDFFRVFYTG